MASCQRLSHLLQRFSSQTSTAFRTYPEKALCQNGRKYLSTSIPTEYLPRGQHGKAVAYKQLAGENPGIVFCPGFQSTMLGVKANALEEYCRKKNLSYVRFDYQGCGESPGDIRDMTLTDWKDDVLAVLDQVTAGAQILVGSSLGGLLMLYTALARPHRIHALVGIATAIDFPRRGYQAYPAEVQEAVNKEGVAYWPDGDMSYILTRALLEDLPNHDILSQEENLKIRCPVHLLHGMQDELIDYRCCIELANRLWTNEVQMIFSKRGDHRFSQPEDILLLFETVERLVFGSKDIRELALSSWSSFTPFPQPDHLVTKDKLLKKY